MRGVNDFQMTMYARRLAVTGSRMRLSYDVIQVACVDTQPCAPPNIGCDGAGDSLSRAW